MRRNALRSALSEKVREGKLICVDKFDVDTVKTNALANALTKNLGIESQALLVPLNDQHNLTLAARNNPRLRVVRAMSVSIVDLLANDTVVVAEDALKQLNEVLAR